MSWGILAGFLLGGQWSPVPHFEISCHCDARGLGRGNLVVVWFEFLN